MTLARNFLNGRLPIILLVMLVLAVFILQPLFHLVAYSFRGADGGLSLDRYAAAFSRPRHFEAYTNSMLLGLWVTIGCLVMAVPFAWAVERTDIPFKNFLRYSVFGSFIIPPYLASVSWILLMNPNSGWLNQLVTLLPFFDKGPFNAFTFPGLAFIIAISSYPYLYIFTATALESVSSEMEDAANILGAGAARTFFLVTIPLILPAVIAGTIITFLEAISLVGTPTLIAVPARLNLVTIELQNFFRPPIDTGAAAAFGMPLLLIAVVLFLLQKLILGRKNYATVTGKSQQRRDVALGAWRLPVLGYCLLIVLITFVLPVLLLVHASFSASWFRPPSWENFTLENYRYLLFSHQHAVNSIVNTVTYSTATATVSVLFAIVAAYLVNRKLTKLGGFISIACLTPFVIPGIIIAIAVYATFAPPPFALYGTMTILVIAFTIRFLPIAFLNTNAALGRINPEMEDAVRILGGSRGTAISRVVAPIMKKSLMGAWLLIFIVSSRELSTAMFLYVPSTRPISITLLDLSAEGLLELLSTLGIMLLLITFAVVGVAVKLLGRDFMKPGARH